MFLNVTSRAEKRERERERGSEEGREERREGERKEYSLASGLEKKQKVR